MEDLITEAAERLLRDHCTPAVVRTVEAGGSASALWRTLEDAGFPSMLAAQALGGSDLSLRECGPVMVLCGAYAVPVPLAETMLARALFSSVGQLWPEGSVTFGTELVADGASVCCAHTHGGAAADWVLAPWQGRACLLRVAEGTAMALGTGLDRRITWPISAVQHLPDGCRADLDTLQACACAAQLAGAMRSVLDRSIAYANTRVQFGRPIGKFQAIQHQLAEMAEHVFASEMAAQLGCAAASALPSRLQVAVGKGRTSAAALRVAAASHAVHGAIGFTSELDLQLYTRRLHSLRHAGGSESYWDDVVGTALCDGSCIVLDFVRQQAA